MVQQTFEPTDEQRKQVEAMKGYGIPEPDIAQLIINPRTNKPIARETLRKHFEYELSVGSAKANAKVAQSLYQQATDDKNTTASIWWTKTRMGWKETQVTEHSGEVKVSWQS